MTSILIVHPDRKTQRTMQRILAITGYTVEVADTLEYAHAALANKPLLVVLDGTFVTQGEAFLSAARDAGAEACITMIGASTARVPLGNAAVTSLLVHPMPVLGEELTVTVQKLIRRDLFGAEKYLLWGTELHTHTITRASQRPQLVRQLSEKIKARGQSARVAAMAMLVADELMSNAIFNAPVDRDGKHFRKELLRDREIDLADGEAVRLRWGCDARYLAVEVTDQYGSLQRDTILGALAKNAVNEVGAGAGMGIALSYRSCDHLVFNLSPGKRTEIIALIDVRYPPSERGPVSSYNVFVERS